MKIIKSGEVIAVMRDDPKDFEGSVRNGNLYVVVGDNDVKLNHYKNPERAKEICTAVHDAYFKNENVFVLPEE